MKKTQLTVGFSPLQTIDGDQNFASDGLKNLEQYKDFIYDIHFPHYNPQICASGRELRSDLSLNDARRITLDMLQWNLENSGFRLTLVLNYLLHNNYKVIVDDFARDFYPRGVRSVVVANLDLIKCLKDRFPDLHIQGSCLSNRITEEELAEEQREGVEIHNPAVHIIRMPEQLKRNANAGFRQKIIIFEGCLHHCPDESAEHGHRWYLARSLPYNQDFCLKTKIATDPRYFFKANWVTIRRLKQLLPYIDVIKLPRSFQTPEYNLKNFIHLYKTDTQYNIIDFLGAGYQAHLARDVGWIPSDLFDDRFYETTENCQMDCAQRRCTLCFDLMNQIKRLSYKQKRLGKRSRHNHSTTSWNVEKNWRSHGRIIP